MQAPDKMSVFVGNLMNITLSAKAFWETSVHTILGQCAGVGTAYPDLSIDSSFFQEAVF